MRLDPNVKLLTRTDLFALYDNKVKVEYILGCYSTTRRGPYRTLTIEQFKKHLLAEKRRTCDKGGTHSDLCACALLKQLEGK